MNYKKGKKIILLYHRVNNTMQDYNRITVSKANFMNQMRILKEKFKVLALDEFLTYEGAENVAAVTFDDGFADFYTNALPILEHFQIPATVFITTGKIDAVEELWTSEILRLIFMNDSECNEICVDLYGRKVCLPLSSIEQRAGVYRIVRQILMQLPEEEQKSFLQSLQKQFRMLPEGRADYQMLTCEQCRQLGNHSLVTIGAHTVNHISMGKVEDAVLEYEIRESIRKLEAIIGDKIIYFAYPFGGKGDYSQRTIELLKHYGIKEAFTVNNSFYQDRVHNAYEIPRFYVDNWEQDQFRNWIDGLLLSEEEPHNSLRRENGFYIGHLMDDELLWNSEEKIIIWGTGIRGRRIKERLFNAGQQDRIIAYGDNNSALWGKKVDGIEVLPLERIKKEDAIVVINNTQDMQIYKQLQLAGVKKVHWII